MANTAIRPFRIAVPDADLVDLRERLARTRWPEREPVSSEDAVNWTQGIPLDYMRELTAYWAQDYDWRVREARLNTFEQFVTEIDGLDIHFIHRRCANPDALPLVITHGWPGSIAEFAKVIEPFGSGLPCRVPVAARLWVLRQTGRAGLERPADRSGLGLLDGPARVPALWRPGWGLGCDGHHRDRP